MTDNPIDERPLNERVDSWLHGIAGDDEVFRLLRLCFGRVILNRKIEDFTKLIRDVNAGFRWLNRSIEMKSDWLDRVDDLGRPKKLMKFSDVDGIMKEIQKSYSKEAQFFAQTVASCDDEEWYADLDDGYHLVKLRTREALLREGGVLQNCIGDGGYDKSIATGEYQYLVLRDDRCRSHAIAQIGDGNLVCEFLGKQNVVPKDKYLHPFVKFLTEREWPVVNRWHRGFVIDDCGHIHLTRSAPEKLCLRGNLWFHSCKDVILPNSLTVSGHLDIRGTTIAILGDTINARSFAVEESSGPALSNHIVVHQELELTPDAIFPSISDTLVVGGTFSMEGNHHVKTMPDYMRVSDNLQAKDTRFPEFGRDTQIKGVVAIFSDSVNEFFIDTDRNLVFPGDIVEIVGDLAGSNRRLFRGLTSRFGVVKSCVGIDGGWVIYPEDSGVSEVLMVGRNLRKVTHTPNKPWRSGTVISDGDTIYFDPFTENLIPVEDDFFKNGGPERGILDLQPLPDFMIEPVGR
jgi:hypothetical protein